MPTNCSSVVVAADHSYSMNNGVAAVTRQSHYATAFRAPDDSLTHRTDVALSQMALQAHERAAGRYYEEKQQQEPASFRPASSAARTTSNGYALQLDSARQQQPSYERTASGRLVPTLDIARVSERAEYEQQQQRRQSTGSVRPGSAQPLGRQQIQPQPQQPQAIGATLVPTTVYRPPSGTSLTKVPHSARARDQIARDLLETRERLRAKAMDKRIREAVASAAQQQSSASAARTAKPRAKSAKKPTSTQRHAEQQQRQEQAFFSQREIEQLQQPYESQRGSASARPQSAGAAGAYQANILRGSQAQAQMFAPNGQPIIQPGSARASPSSSNQQPPQQPQWGRAHESTDRAGQLVSSSVQSRLTAEDVAAQPVAGRPSGSNGGELAAILAGGGGHQHKNNK